MAETEEGPWQFMYLDDDDDKSVVSLPSIKTLTDDLEEEGKVIAGVSKNASKELENIFNHSQSHHKKEDKAAHDFKNELTGLEEGPRQLLPVDEDVNKNKASLLPTPSVDRVKEDKETTSAAAIIAPAFPFKCQQCEMAFQTEKQLFGHNAVAHNFKLKCNMCNEVFYQQKSWKIHLMIHPQVFECEECGMTFTKRFHYRKHRLQHQNGAEYNCDQGTHPFQGNSMPVPELPGPKRPIGPMRPTIRSMIRPIIPCMGQVWPIRIPQTMPFHYNGGPLQQLPRLIQSNYVVHNSFRFEQHRH